MGAADGFADFILASLYSELHSLKEPKFYIDTHSESTKCNC